MITVVNVVLSRLSERERHGTRDYGGTVGQVLLASLPLIPKWASSFNFGLH